MADFMNDAPIQAKREKVRIKLKKEEREFYSKLFDAAKPKGSNKLSGNDAVTFFRKAKVSGEIMKKIWQIAAQTDLSYLDRDEFYVALKLLALAQSGREISLASIQNNVETQLPIIEGFYPNSMNPMGNGMMMPPSQIMMPPQMMIPPQMPPGVPPQQTISQSPYSATDEELAKYAKIFDTFDTGRKGELTADQLAEALKRTKLPEAILSKVWELAEATESGNFDKLNVIMILHLLIKYKAGIEIPKAIPSDLKTTIHNFLLGKKQAPPPPPQVPLIPPPMIPVARTAPRKADSNDPFDEIEPAESFGGGIMPLYAYPQLPAPMPIPSPQMNSYAAPQPVIEEQKNYTMNVQNENFSMSPSRIQPSTVRINTPERQKSGNFSNPTNMNEDLVKQMLQELQKLNLEKSSLKSQISSYKTQLKQEETILSHHLNELLELPNEYFGFVRTKFVAHTSPTKPQNMPKTEKTIGQNTHFYKDQSSEKTSGSFGPFGEAPSGNGFGWNPTVDGKVNKIMENKFEDDTGGFDFS